MRKTKMCRFLWCLHQAWGVKVTHKPLCKQHDKMKAAWVGKRAKPLGAPLPGVSGSHSWWCGVWVWPRGSGEIARDACLDSTTGGKQTPWGRAAKHGAFSKDRNGLVWADSLLRGISVPHSRQHLSSDRDGEISVAFRQARVNFLSRGSLLMSSLVCWTSFWVIILSLNPYNTPRSRWYSVPLRSEGTESGRG